jgi:hypothetical protein
VGAAFSRDLPGQSRLKTAPTIQEQQIQNYKVSFPIRLDARGQRRRLYETTFQKLELVLSWATFCRCYCEMRNPTTADFGTVPQKFLFRLN